LYICRELCERYGARINYRLRPAGDRRRNEFSVALRRQTVYPAARAGLTAS
jgi:two-component system sensor histidine kinase PilS (NtrC family)